MKLFKICILAFALLLVSLPTEAASTTPQIAVQYLENGDYIETLVVTAPTLTRASTRSGKKTATYKNSAGTTMWSVTVSASFSYTSGKSSTCTSVSGSTSSSSSNWKVTSASTSKSGNSATASATGKHYSGSSLVATYSRSITLRCDTNGNLS